MGTQRTRESAVPAHRGDHRRRAHFSRFGEIDIRYLIWGAVGYSPQSRHFSILGGVFLASITTVRLPQDVNILPRVMKGLGGKVLLETYRAWGRATWELRAFLIEAANIPVLKSPFERGLFLQRPVCQRLQKRGVSGSGRFFKSREMLRTRRNRLHTIYTLRPRQERTNTHR